MRHKVKQVIEGGKYVAYWVVSQGDDKQVVHYVSSSDGVEEVIEALNELDIPIYVGWQTEDEPSIVEVNGRLVDLESVEYAALASDTDTGGIAMPCDVDYFPGEEIDPMEEGVEGLHVLFAVVHLARSVDEQRANQAVA